MAKNKENLANQAQSYRDYVTLWAKRAVAMKSMATYDLQRKDLDHRLKSIAYFNQIFAERLASSHDDHHSSGLVDYTKLLAKLKTMRAV